MRGLIIGMTLGAIAGAVAFKKFEDSRLPEKALKTAQKKLKDIKS